MSDQLPTVYLDGNEEEKLFLEYHAINSKIKALEVEKEALNKKIKTLYKAGTAFVSSKFIIILEEVPGTDAKTITEADVGTVIKGRAGTTRLTVKETPQPNG